MTIAPSLDRAPLALELQPGTAGSLRHLDSAVVLTVRRGAVWVTQLGELQDHALVAGERLRLPANAHTVLEPLEGAAAALTVAFEPAA